MVKIMLFNLLETDKRASGFLTSNVLKYNWKNNFYLSMNYAPSWRSIIASALWCDEHNCKAPSQDTMRTITETSQLKPQILHQMVKRPWLHYKSCLKRSISCTCPTQSDAIMHNLTCLHTEIEYSKPKHIYLKLGSSN